MPNTLVLGPNKERIYPTASLHVQKIHSPLSLHYGLFGQGGDLLRQLNHVFKDTPIPLLPHIPHDVYSFLKFHMTYIAALLVSGSHHSTKEAGSCCGHCTKKKGPLHTTQWSWFGQSLFCRLFSIRILLYRGSRCRFCTYFLHTPSR